MAAVTIHSDFGAQENKVPYKIFVAINKVKINNYLRSLQAPYFQFKLIYDLIDACSLEEKL